MTPEQTTLIVRDYLVPASPGATLTRILEIHAGGTPDTSSTLKLLQDNPAYAQIIIKQARLAQKITQWKEECGTSGDLQTYLLHRIIGLMGQSSTRDLIASLRLSRVLGKGIPRKKGDVIELKPQEQLAFALKTEEFCASQNWAFPEMAYVAGLHYDWLLALLQARKASEEAKKILAEAHLEGLRIAECAVRVSQQIKSIHLDRYVLASSIVLPLGKVLMAVLYPKGAGEKTWSGVMAEAEKYGRAKWAAVEHFEKSQLEDTYPEMSALFAQAFELIAPAAPAIRFALEPWMLASANNDQRQLGMILSVANSLARSNLGVPVAELPLLEFQNRWLSQSAVRAAALKKALFDSRKAAPK